MATTNNEKNTFKKLSIQVNLNGLSFCILDANTNEILFLKRFNFERQLDPLKLLDQVERCYEEYPELNQEIDEVKLVFSNPLFSLVPAEYFDEENAASYLKFNTRILKTDFITFDSIRNEMVNIYIPYTNITNYFFDRYGEFEYKHGLSVLIENLLELPKTKEPKVYLHVQPASFDLVVIEGGQLVFANSFEYETKEDFLYYILFCAEQLQLDPEKFELILFGDITRDSDEYEMAWNYIRNISFMGPFHSYSIPGEETKDDIQANYLLIKSL